MKFAYINTELFFFSLFSMCVCCCVCGTTYPNPVWKKKMPNTLLPT